MAGCGGTADEQTHPGPEPGEDKTASSASLRKGAALVLTLAGKVTVVGISDANESAAEINQFLDPGDSLLTGPDSEALLLLTNGTTLSVGTDTKLELKAFYQENFDSRNATIGSLEEEASSSTVLLDLQVGDLVVDVKKLRKNSNFEISTPLGVAGIRGTSFKLLASADSTTLSVLTGRVDFVSPSEENFQVEASQGILAPKGDDPQIKPLAEKEKQAIKQAVDKAREKADEVDLNTLKDGLSFKNHVVPAAANLEMLWVEPGTFMMGSPPTEADRNKNETQHQVTLSKGFYLGKYEVTQAQYQAVAGSNPSEFNATGNGNRPVDNMIWTEANAFCSQLTKMEQNAGRLPEGWAYALLTEAEWEYACRAGTTTAYFWGNTITAANANWNYGKDPNQTVDVGQFAPNPWGFYDMHGNVSEWTTDKYKADYPSGLVTDPEVPSGRSSATLRVRRGGAWGSRGKQLRSAERGFTAGRRWNSIGFRLALKKIN